MRVTAIFEADLSTVSMAIRMFSADVQFRAVGRLTAVQSPLLDFLGAAKVRSAAQAMGLPLKMVLERPSFDDEPQSSGRVVVDPSRRKGLAALTSGS